MNKDQKESAIAWGLVVSLSITLTILCYVYRSRSKEVKQPPKIEYTYAKPDSVYSDKQNQVFEYWVKLDSKRFKN